MKKTVAGIILLLLIAAGLYFFNALGGFNEIKISIEDLGEIELVGIHYRGTPQDESLGNSFMLIEGLQKENSGSILHTIYYVEPAGKLDTMEVFVGIEKKWLEDISGKKILSLDGHEAIVAEIEANRFVMPGPNKVKSKIEEFAKSNNMPVPNIYVDQILGPEHVRVIGIYQTDEK
ncbi:GyrI-like domain-containing protein [Cecembia rubra]|uniref:GyrI-like small molecule binding domain-containing protein n=1 Tax=Cecembia rubra TaxID=1485585 RepID=A0A2P8DNF4_9BACT|nr:GyrI-like domain-containing protein [Cecembia rubra]PSK98756.1 hypothetical protein CLV48_11843 [Cecembia rubra]